MKKKLLALLLSIIMILSLPGGAFAADEVTGADTAEAAQSIDYMEKVDELADMIKIYHAYATELDDPVRQALNRYFNDNPEEFAKFADYMLKTYDDYSHYLTAEQYAESFATSDDYVGIGISLDTSRTDGNFVESVVPGTPAEKAGIGIGDEIVSVDGVDVTDYVYTSLVNLIRGEEDTEVTIGIRHKGEDNVKLYTLTRVRIDISNVIFEDLGDGVAYIKIVRFGDIMTFIDFVGHYLELPYQGFRSLIIDVRDNPGGSLEVLLNILNYVMTDKAVMFSIETRTSTETYMSTGGGWELNEIIVLVNENSASAAEVFAGALQKNEMATVIGQQTYGKGVGQYHFEMPDGSVAVITNFEILLSDGTGYHNEGIVPDEEIELEVRKIEIPKIGKLDAKKTMRVGDENANVLALEHRLKLLGYFAGTPDEIFDEETLAAVIAVQNKFGLRRYNYATESTLKTINEQMKIYENTLVVVDTQLERAYELAKEAAEQPLSFEPPSRDFSGLDGN